jgi:maltose O-acetyltransferase
MPTRAQRGLRRVSIHLMNTLSDLLGDDVISRRIRTALLRANGARIGSGTYFHGGTHFTNPRNLTIGDDCFVNRNCYFDLESSITIGDSVVLGHGTTLITTHHRLGPSQRRSGAFYGEPVQIEDGAWLGANVILMPGVSVGPGAVVGAGSLVRTDVEPDTVVGGVPARLLGNLPVHEPGPDDEMLSPAGRYDG